MGQKLLGPQLRQLQQLIEGIAVDSVELLWLPGYIQVVIWDKMHNCTTHRIDEDGEALEQRG